MERVKPFIPLKGQKIIKIIHMIFLAVLAGGYIIIGVFQLFKGFSPGAQPLHFDIVALQIFSVSINYAAYGILVTSLMYSFMTQWGLFRYWWIIAKWIGLAAVYILSLGFVGGQLSTLAMISSGGAIPGGPGLYSQTQQLLNAELFIVIIILVFMMFLSIYKPWGKRKIQKEYSLHIPGLILVAITLAGIGFSVFMEIQLNRLRNLPVRTVNAENLPDGEYKGVWSDNYSDYTVIVSVKNKKIIDIKGENLRDSMYVQYARGVFNKVVKAQSTGVDVVTGATTTSKVLLKAIETALTSGKKQ